MANGSRPAGRCGRAAIAIASDWHACKLYLAALNCPRNLRQAPHCNQELLDGGQSACPLWHSHCMEC